MKIAEAIKKIEEARGALKELGWAAGQARDCATPENVETVKDVLSNFQKAADEIDAGLLEIANGLATSR